MTDVLAVTARKLGNPMTFLVQPIADDRTIHYEQ
jgi:hypothetical protein